MFPRFLIVLLFVLGQCGLGHAHHGFTGEYNFSRPIYLSGVISEARHGLPHAQFVVDVPADLELPADRSALGEIEKVEKRATLKLLQLPTQRGAIPILLEPTTTRLLVERKIPTVGDRVEVIAYERVSNDDRKGEYRVMLLRTRSETFVAPVRSYHKEKGD